ncbi:MAG: DUF4395 domain-containing protein [Sulfuricurvum sp.]|nr:DUF4395 domain-containing protein [Sulfuricurvum sp.]MDD5387197.1 DUF4395 domain-containing protein [Sulfuricurvum sp.]
MSQACPLLFRQIDATISKISAAVVMSSVIVYLITMQKWILVFLILDFIVRLSGYKTLSPVFQFANSFQNIFKLPTHFEDAGAKRLAAFFGLIFMISMLIADFGGWIPGVWSVAGIFISCVLLDLFFNYCIACKVYSAAKKIYPKGFL